MYYFNLLICVASYLLISYFLKMIFFRGKVDKNNWVVFNFSIYAEIILTIIYFFIGIILLIGAVHASIIWYKLIFVIFMVCWFLFKSYFVFASRNNFIKVKGRELKYRDGKEQTSIIFESYKFTKKDTAMPSFAFNQGWFLELKPLNDDKIVLLDLKYLNLEGYKNSLEKYFNELETENY